MIERWIVSARGRVAHFWVGPAPRTVCGQRIHPDGFPAPPDTKLCQECIGFVDGQRQVLSNLTRAEESDWWKGMVPQTIKISGEAFDELLALLEREPQENPKLRELMTQKSNFAPPARSPDGPTA